MRLATVFADLPRTGRVCSVRSRSNFCFRAGDSRPAHSATEGPRSPAFEYLGTLSAETGTRTVIENGPQGTRATVQVVGGRLEGPRLKASVQTPASDWITNRADDSPHAENRRSGPILVTYNGIRQTTNAGASLQIVPLFETGDSRYA